MNAPRIITHRTAASRRHKLSESNFPGKGAIIQNKFKFTIFIFRMTLRHNIKSSAKHFPFNLKANQWPIYVNVKHFSNLSQLSSVVGKRKQLKLQPELCKCYVVWNLLFFSSYSEFSLKIWPATLYITTQYVLRVFSVTNFELYVLRNYL